MSRRLPLAAAVFWVVVACGGDGGGGLNTEPPPSDLGTTSRTLSTGAVRLMIDNRGIIGRDPATGRGFGFFPAGSLNDYVFGSGLWVGGLFAGEPVVATAYDMRTGKSEFVPGRVVGNGGGGGRILCSSSPRELAAWYPEFRDPVGGQPRVMGDEDCVVIFNDAGVVGGDRSVGLEVRQRVAIFHSGLAVQTIVFTWDVLNASPQALEQAFVAVGTDFDVGVSDDDRCSAIPFQAAGSPASGAANLGFCWDADFTEASFDPQPPGFVGVVLLHGPDPAIAPVLTRFTLRNPTPAEPDGVPDPDPDKYAQLRGEGRWPPVIGPVSQDQRFLAVAGPVRFEPGQVRRFVAAYVWADVSAPVDELPTQPAPCFASPIPCFLPDPGDPTLRELLQVRQIAQELADARIPLEPDPP